MKKGAIGNSRLVRSIKRGWCRQPRVAIIGGAAILLVAFVAVRLLSGNPYVALRLLNVRCFLPPLWILTIVFGGLFALSGGACGAVIGGKCVRDVEKYRGGMFFVLMAVFSLMWYPLIFVGFAVFSGMICLAIAVFFGVMCTVNFFCVHKLAAIIIAAYLLWLLYLFIANCSIFFSI